MDSSAGYVSGETIHINGYVRNFSKVTIRHTKIILLETINYLSRGKVVQVEKREIASIKGPKIRPSSRDEFVNKKLYIPPLPPTNIRNSNLIQLNYDVYVSSFIVELIFSRIFCAILIDWKWARALCLLCAGGGRGVP